MSFTRPAGARGDEAGLVGAQSCGKGGIQLEGCPIAGPCGKAGSEGQSPACSISALSFISQCLPAERGCSGTGCELEQSFGSDLGGC